MTNFSFSHDLSDQVYAIGYAIEPIICPIVTSETGWLYDLGSVPTAGSTPTLIGQRLWPPGLSYDHPIRTMFGTPTALGIYPCVYMARSGDIYLEKRFVIEVIS